MTLNGLLAQAIAALKGAGPFTVFVYAFATGFGFFLGLCMAASVFDILPSPFSP
jgi:hypothetical protein